MDIDKILNFPSAGYTFNPDNITYIKWEKNKAIFHFHTHSLVVEGNISPLKEYFNYIDPPIN